MANHVSAQKRARQNVGRNARNQSYLGGVRTAVKKLRLAIAEQKDSETLQSLFRAAQSLVARASAKGLLHGNNASRRIGRLANALKNATGSGNPAVKKAALPAPAAATSKKTAAAPKKANNAGGKAPAKAPAKKAPAKAAAKKPAPKKKK